MSYHLFPNLGQTIQDDLVGNIKRGIGPKDILNCECNCNYTTKVQVICAYGGECISCGSCVVYKATRRKCLSVYVGNTQNNPPKITEQHYQDVDQKVQYDKNLDTFAAHFAQHFDQKSTPQQCRKIMNFGILFTVNPIMSMKTWSK